MFTGHYMLSIFILSLCGTSHAKSKCETCTDIVSKFYEGLKTTAKSNFAGGNTHWEEKSLGSYAFSETRLVEILDNVCSSDNNCHSLLEEYEEAIEQWWFKHYGKKKETAMHTYLCIERISGACCASGKWGPKCSSCPGLDGDTFCSGHGKCDGNGTREGSGECECDEGYTGELCYQCEADFYHVTSGSEDVTVTTCEKCHAGCEEGCSGPDATHCDACKAEGWASDIELGCVDVNECEADTSPCKDSEYCENTEGSYSCLACHSSCAGCTGEGADNCAACADNRYSTPEGVCKACHASCSGGCSDGTARGCEACKEGWVASDQSGCQDVNECETTPCGDGQYCINTPGSFRCKDCDAACDGCTGIGDKNCRACAPGYQLQEDSNKCADVDECVESSRCPGDHERCENLPGSYECRCDDGFTRKDGTCVQKAEKEKKKESNNGAYRGPADCSTCKDIVENIWKGIEATASSNFGGGNTKWEEQKLGSYQYSETRWAEVLEHVCVDNEKKCAHIVERYEDTLEKWWRKSFRNDKNLDLVTWFCIDRAQVCCAEGTYGENCSRCPGGDAGVCSSHGKCDGEGTRKGSGKCTCDKGYSGELCDQCAKSHFQVSRTLTSVECKECDSVCGESGCVAEGPQGCEGCKKGYAFDEDHDTGCHDINECEAETSPCKEKEKCINNPGSYKCIRCDRSCSDCTDRGNDHCVECAPRFFNDTGRCKACHRACEDGCTGPASEQCLGACRRGYEPREGGGCQDIDECASKQDHCKGSTYCQNTYGHYSCKRCDMACAGSCSKGGPDGCVACKKGYTRQDGQDTAPCVDVDECATADTHDCTGEHKKCVNVPGKYLCDCETGFQMDDDKVCQPLTKDEMMMHQHMEHIRAQTSGSTPENELDSEPSPEDLVDPTLNDEYYVTMSGSFEEKVEELLADNKDEL